MTFSKGGACFDCHSITWAGDAVQMAPVKLTQRYMPRGAFDHSVPEHGGPGPSKAGGYKCADCHKAATSERTADVLIPDLASCRDCHMGEGDRSAEVPSTCAMSPRSG